MNLRFLIQKVVFGTIPIFIVLLGYATVYYEAHFCTYRPIAYSKSSIIRPYMIQPTWIWNKHQNVTPDVKLESWLWTLLIFVDLYKTTTGCHIKILYAISKKLLLEKNVASCLRCTAREKLPKEMILSSLNLAMYGSLNVPPIRKKIIPVFLFLLVSHLSFHSSDVKQYSTATEINAQPGSTSWFFTPSQ